MTVRVYGHIPDEPDPKDWILEDGKLMTFRPLVAGQGSWDYSPNLDAVQNQLGGSCVGQSIASSAYLLGQTSGRPIKRPSALWPYSIARLLDDPGAPLIDIGCRPRVAMLGCRERGLVALERWPETADTLNAVPPLDAFQAGECGTIEAFYRIADDGDVKAGICHALARGYCPIFGMPVDTRYEQIGSAIYDGPGGAFLGNHAQVIVGYSAILDAFKVLNSWGTSFGDGGFAWISASFMASRTFDKWVIQVAPEVH